MRGRIAVAIVILMFVGIAVVNIVNTTYGGSFERYRQEAPVDFAETFSEIAKRSIPLIGND